jgi:hypothetical protein
MLGDGRRCRRLEEDASVLVLPHQVSLVGMPRQYDAPSTVGLDEFGIQHLSNLSDLGSSESDSGRTDRCCAPWPPSPESPAKLVPAPRTGGHRAPATCFCPKATGGSSPRRNIDRGRTPPTDPPRVRVVSWWYRQRSSPVLRQRSPLAGCRRSVDCLLGRQVQAQNQE